MKARALGDSVQRSGEGGCEARRFVVPLAVAAVAGAVVLAGLLLMPPVARAQARDDFDTRPGTSFLSGPELGERLLHNVVRLSTPYEHGFGLVVAAGPRHVYVATARHVVSAPQGEPAASAPQVEVSFCAPGLAAAGSRPAEVVPSFDAGGHDLALLRVLRPEGYEPVVRALAAGESVELRQPTWLLGREQRCGVAARGGAISSLRDARDNLRIEFPGVQGGASGGPVITGYGVVGLVTDAEDLSFTVHSIDSLQARLRAGSAGWWDLAPARNIPPSDPRAAEIDLAETLNQYLFAVRNLQRLLQQPSVPRQLFFDFSKDYNAAIHRFRDARDRYDGTLARDWPPGALDQWSDVRARLWAVHQAFWRLNEGDAKAIFDQRQAPPQVRERMQALEPDLQQLEQGMTRFLDLLGKRSKP